MLHPTGPAFRRLMASFLAMLVLPLAVLLFNYVYARHLLEQENLNYQNAVLIQAQKMIDEKLQALQLRTIDAANDEAIAHFLSSDDLRGVELYIRARELSAKLKTHNAVDRELCTYYIYSRSYDCLVGTDATDYDISQSLVQLPTEALNAQLLEKLTSPYQFAHYNVLRDGSTTALVLLHTVPLWSTGEPAQGAICLVVNTRALLKNLSTMEELQSGFVCLLDENGGVISSAGETDLLDAIPQALALQRGFLKVGSTNYTVSLVDSVLGGWQYLSIQPQHAMLTQLRLTRNLSLGVFAVVLVLGCAAAYLFTRRNYRPIEHLMDSLRHQAGLARQQADTESEFDLIERSVQDIARSMSEVRTLLQDELPRIQESILMQLLRNAVTDYPAFCARWRNGASCCPTGGLRWRCCASPVPSRRNKRCSAWWSRSSSSKPCRPPSPTLRPCCRATRWPWCSTATATRWSRKPPTPCNNLPTACGRSSPVCCTSP